MRSLIRLPLERPWAFWLLALVVLATGLGLREPWPADEPRFALIARDMVLTGDWFFPRVAGDLYPDKPPVFFWAIASVYWLIGDLEIAFLLPSLLAGLGTLWLVQDLGRRLWDERTGRVAALALLFTLQFTIQARVAQIDMSLCLFTTLGLYGLVRHLLHGPHLGWLFVGWAAMGAGIITKGVGFLPVLVLLPWLWARCRGWPGVADRPREPRAWMGPLAMLAVVGAWFLPMLWLTSTSGDPLLIGYRDEILFHQTVSRYADAWHHIEPFWYYLVEVLPWFWLPLTALLPWLVPAWNRDLRSRDPRILLLLGYVVAVVIFFSLSPGKRGVYMLPALPAFVLAAAPYLSGLVERRGSQRAALALTIVFGGAAAATFLYYRMISPEAGSALVERYEVAPWAFLISIATIATVCILWGGRRRAVPALLAFLSAFWVLMGIHAYPLADPFRSGRGLMAEAADRVGERYTLGLIHWAEQQALQAEQPLVHFGFRRHDWHEERLDGVAWLMTTPHTRLLVDEPIAEDCFDVDREDSLGYYHRRHWFIVGPEDIVGICARQWPQRRWDSQVNRHYYALSALRLR